MDSPRSASPRPNSLGTARTDLVTGGVTMAAILLFVFTGSAVMPSAVRAIAGLGMAADRIMITALLLNLALIIFGWRRCHDLKKEVAERTHAEAQARLLASRDPLTGFLNRRSLTETAHACLDGDAPAMLLLIDLDRFKDVNDLHGHATGDALLRAVAAIVKDSIPRKAITCRLGGDEFAILLHGGDGQAVIADAVAERILGRMRAPIQVGNVFVHVGASIGLATVDRGGGIDALLRRADIAMYEAKRAGRDGFAWFDDGMESAIRERSAIETGIRIGIPLGQFVPYFEQQIDLVSGRLHGFEVLARWNHPERGLVGPDTFISVAEASGLISDLSIAVIRAALIEAKDWNDALTIAINISPVQLKDPLLAQRLVQLLVETGFPASRLEVEITESALFDNLALAKTSMESLKNQGIRISLDDFGTGYSSLSHLQALPFDRLKIDRSFVATMRGNAESSAIVSAITRLGETLGLPVTAEGIEDIATLRIVEALGCSDGQGWHFGRPMTGRDVTQWLATGDVPIRKADKAVEPNAPAGLDAIFNDLAAARINR